MFSYLDLPPRKKELTIRKCIKIVYDREYSFYLGSIHTTLTLLGSEVEKVHLREPLLEVEYKDGTLVTYYQVKLRESTYTPVEVLYDYVRPTRYFNGKKLN